MTTYDNIERLAMPVDNQTWESASSYIFAELIGELQPAHIIEVGSWKGVSALIMAELGKPYGTHVHCVDTWLGSYEHFMGADDLPRDEWGYPKLFHQFLTNIKAAGYSEKITPYPMCSNDGARYLKNRAIFPMLIYIDGDHSMTGCYNDLVAYWPLLLPGGVMFGDDHLVFAPVFAAVIRFCCERGIDMKTNGSHWVLRKI